MELLVGTYSQPLAGMAGNGEGIHGVSFDPRTGAFGTPHLLAQCVNPSSLALTPDGRTVFAGREVFASDGPALLSFGAGPGAALTGISRVALSGELPCHLAFDPVHGRLASAQYWTGDVAVCTVVDGILQAPPTYLVREGSGTNAARQEGPHAHCVAFSDDGEVLHLVDLGTDCIVSHRLDSENRAVETTALQLPAGCGPRHMVMTGDRTRAFVLCELDESLVALTRAGLGWKVASIQAGFVAPDDEDGAGAAIRLSPDERHLYLSGRRQSAIAGFGVADAPVPLGEIDSGGLSPRDFILTSDGAWVIAANQNSNLLASFSRDPESGLLTASGHVCAIGSPVALVEWSSGKQQRAVAG